LANSVGKMLERCVCKNRNITLQLVRHLSTNYDLMVITLEVFFGVSCFIIRSKDIIIIMNELDYQVVISTTRKVIVNRTWVIMNGDIL
jgi:CO dehydrogenase nickel-insertion accessory protein CooC1